MEFKILKRDDRDLISEYFKKYPPQISEFTFTNLYLWRHARPVYFIEFMDSLIFFIDGNNENDKRKVIFGPPAGEVQINDLIASLRKYISGAVRINSLTAEIFTNRGIHVEEEKDNDDYVYLVSDLSLLEGRKYSKKRNHIKNCLNDYNCQYEEITSSIINECIDLQDKWCNIKGCDIQPGLFNENRAIREAFNEFGALGLIGGAIRVNGVIQAYTIGERLNSDTAVCHFEKANTDFNGLNQLITHWFAKFNLKDYLYVNREQDLGNPGLRQAKLSYYPHHMVNKFIAAFDNNSQSE